MLEEVPLLRGLLWEPKCTPKSQKYVIFNMVKNATPELNLESDLMVHLFLMGLSDSELLGLPKWQERLFSLNCYQSHLLTVFAMHLKKLVIGGAIGNLTKMTFPVILASPKAQNLIIPSKIDEPLSQIPNSARGWHFWPCWSLHILGCFWLHLGSHRVPWGVGLPPTWYLECPLMA